MKKFTVLAVAVMMIFGVAGVASAVTFESIVDWNELGLGFKTIDDSNLGWGDPYPFAYEHTVLFDPAAVSVDSAMLTLTYSGNKSGLWNTEAWFLTDAGDFKLGDLQQSNMFDWVEQSFVLAPSMLAGISGTSWTIGFKMAEGTGGFLDYDALLIDKSVLSGEYSPVPEPGTVLLLGSGILGLIALKRKLR